MRIGIMGVHYGHISSMFQAAANAKNGQLVGMVEADDALYERYNAQVAMPRYANLQEMLTQAQPDIILEGVTHLEKTALVEACAAAGVHLIMDKPLCRTFEDWHRMQQAVQIHGIEISMWYTSRSYPPFMALRRAVLDGELGEIVSLISTHPHKISRKSGTDWYFDKNKYTGTFHDLACHGLDQVRWLTGAECVGVHALETCMRFTDEPHLTDHVQASFQLSTGATALLTADWLTPKNSPSFGDTRFILMGTSGSAHLRAYAQDHVLIVSNARGGAYVPEMPQDQGGRFVENMISAIERGEELFIPTRDVLAVAQACLMAQQSAASGGAFLEIPTF